MRNIDYYTAAVAVVFVSIFNEGAKSLSWRQGPPPAPWLLSSASSSKASSKVLDSDCGARVQWPGSSRQSTSTIDIPKSHRVHNGYTAIEGQFPSYVDIVSVVSGNLNRSLVWQCGGTLLTPSIVLTAAHCVDEPDIESITVSPSIYLPSSIKGLARVLRVCLSARYDPINSLELAYDYAVLVMERPFAVNRKVRSACLPSRPAKPTDSCYVLGNGITNASGWGSSKRLQYFPAHRSPGECNRRRIKASELIACFVQNKNQFVDGKESSSCRGDSGSGVLCYIDGTWEVHGIVSTGPPTRCESGNAGTFYTNVEKISNEIVSLAQTC